MKTFIKNIEVNLILPKNLKTLLGTDNLKQNVPDKAVEFTKTELEILAKLSTFELIEKSCDESQPTAESEETEEFKKLPKSRTVSSSHLKQIKKILDEKRSQNKSDKYLHEILNGSELILPQNEIQERNPVLEARCQRLKAEQDRLAYQKMTKNVDSSRKNLPEDTISYQIKQINKQLIAVLQFIFSVLAGFAFGFIGIGLIVGDLDFGFRLLLGIMAALIIALAEIYFLAKKLNEEYAEPCCVPNDPNFKLKTN